MFYSGQTPVEFQFAEYEERGSGVEELENVKPSEMGCMVFRSSEYV